MGQKRREGNKDFKKAGQAGSRGGCLKKGGEGAGTPLRTMGLIFHHILCMIFFWKTHCSCYILSTVQILFSDYLNFLDSRFILIITFPIDDVIHFEINLRFLMKSFFYMTKKVRTKIWISLERKELLRCNKKHFSSFLETSQLTEII